MAARGGLQQCKERAPRNQHLQLLPLRPLLPPSRPRQLLRRKSNSCLVPCARVEHDVRVSDLPINRDVVTKEKTIPEGAVKVSRAQIQEERAKKLGARFGIEFESHEWQAPEGDVLRIDKAPRMRIHRQCHKCQSGFGAGNECPSCEHVRCKKCTRNPPKKTDAEKEAARTRKEELARQRKENAPIIPSYDYSDIHGEIIIRRPARVGNVDLVFRPPRVRIRRNCHACNTLITSGSSQPRTCDACGHKRCDDCPRQPYVAFSPVSRWDN